MRFKRILSKFLFKKRKQKFTYARDGLHTYHNADFINNPRFSEAYNKGKQTGSWGKSNIEWRVHVCLWLTSQAVKLDGDFVECGTNLGGMATSILEYHKQDINFQKKRFFCFDTFNGLSEKYASSQEISNTSDSYFDCFELVQKHFSQYPQVTLVRGAVPDTLKEFTGENLAFIHIDMNSAIPEIAAAEYFWPYLVEGGYMLLDDFAWQICKAQRDVFIQFAQRHQIEILWLPTGQGLIQKPYKK